MSWYVAVLVATALLGCAATAIAIPALRKAEILDGVTHRSSHTTTTVRGGGVAVLVSFAAGAALLVLAGPTTTRLSWAPTIAAITIVAYGLLGWLEDARGLSVRRRLIAQVGLAVCAAAAAAGVGAGLLLCIAAVGVAVFYVNAANFMDGVNGISSLHAIAAGSYFFFVGQHLDSPALSLVALCGVGAFLGFLPWNFPAAKVFLGDVGSYTLGAFVWALSFWAATQTSLVVALAPMIVYATDVVFTLGRRAKRGERLSEAHREHVYQRLQQSSGSHAAAALVVTAATILACVSGWLVLTGQISAALGTLLCITTAVLFCTLPSVLRRKKAVMG